MNAMTEIWLTRTIPSIGLKFNSYSQWPLLPMSDVGAEGYYQPVADNNGAVFLRYGPGETVEQYLANLGGKFTEVMTVRDEEWLVSGQHGRRVHLLMVTQPIVAYRRHADGALGHNSSHTERAVIVIIGFSSHNVPVLVGYRVPEEVASTIATTLDTFLDSVETYEVSGDE